jgi:hypothetical protein
MRKISVGFDWWAVILALAAALGVRFGLIPHIPW